MIAKYYIELCTQVGVPIDIISDFEYLQFTTVLNDIGMAVFALPETHSSLDSFEESAIIKIWRWHPELNSGVSVSVFAGIFQGFTHKVRNGRVVVEVIFPYYRLFSNTSHYTRKVVVSRLVGS